jgi:hypothetical protein
VLHLAQYRTPTDATKETVDDDAVLSEFQASQGMPATDWSQLVMQRVPDPAALMIPLHSSGGTGCSWRCGGRRLGSRMPSETIRQRCTELRIPALVRMAC